ncbi:MAG: hypothetical protein ACOCYB_00470 [Alkalispirochaeta sp.]
MKRLLMVVTPVLLLSACLSVPSGTPTDPADEPASPAAEQQRARDYLFDTPENTVMDTPWFSVSSVVLQIQRTQPETVIAVPRDRETQRVLALWPGSEPSDTLIPGNRFLFNLGIMTDGIPPFTDDPDRYRYPDLYE